MKTALAITALSFFLVAFTNCSGGAKALQWDNSQTIIDPPPTPTPNPNEPAACAPSAVHFIEQTAGLNRHDLAIDGNGVLYSASTAGNSISIRYSRDGGTTWMNAPALPGISGTTTPIRLHIAASPTNKLYVIAYGSNLGGQATQFVWRAVEPGGVWTNLEAASNAHHYRDIHVDNQENIFAVGSRTNAGAQSGWYIRRSQDGAAFTTTDFIADQAGTQKTPFALTVTSDENGIIYVGGVTSMPGTLYEMWTLRRSTDRGVSFQTVDTYLSAMPTWSTLLSISVKAGTVYTTGQAGELVNGQAYPYLNRWITRVGSVTYSTTQRLPVNPTEASVLSGRKILADSRGRVFMVGYKGPTNFIASDFIAQVSKDQGQTWLPVYSEAASGNFDGDQQADEIVVDKSGQLIISRADGIRAVCY
ncbi:MAG: hypothetical protein ABL958_10400 [Bdellovibrionia bacterium]